MRMKLKPRQTKGEYVMGRMAQLIRFMNETYRGKRGRLAALTGILLLRSLCEVSFPLWSGFIIDSAIKKDGEAIMIYGSLFFMAVVGRITFSVISHNVSIHSQIDLSLRSKKRVMGLLVSGEKISASVGDLEEFVENDIDGISKGFEAVANIIANLAIFLIAGIYLRDLSSFPGHQHRFRGHHVDSFMRLIYDSPFEANGTLFAGVQGRIRQVDFFRLGCRYRTARDTRRTWEG